MLQVRSRQYQVSYSCMMETNGRVSGPEGAARLLGIPRQTLDSKIEGLGIDKRRFKSARKN
jgi:hypothetical protein